MTGGRLISWAIAAGLVLGFAYTLSPLTVLSALALWPVWTMATRDLDPRERRWLAALVGAAIALRLTAIVTLFMTADPAIPYAYFFGDEEFFNRKSTWLMNVAKGIPISRADFLYAFDRTGKTSYLTVLQYVQALVGLAPYGIHVMNTACYLGTVLLLFKVVRPVVGGIAALFGVTVLLFLPSLTIWSMSALKEPLYLLVAALNFACAIRAFRAPDWPTRLASLALVAAGGYVLQTLREGGLVLTVAGVAGGGILAFLVRRPRLLIATAVAAPLLLAVALRLPAVQDRVWPQIHSAVEKHWGHVNTPGLTYRLMEPSFYDDRSHIKEMTGADAVRYGVRGIWSFVTVPAPWAIESRSALAFLPEQMVWYMLVILIPIGAVAGFKRDPLMTSMLLAHGVAIAMIVALSGGNIGTLVRHRGLALPYFVWLGGLGVVRVAQVLYSPSILSLQRPVAHGTR